jgi:hypothetical protein
MKRPKWTCLQGFHIWRTWQHGRVIAWAAGLYEGEGTVTRCGGYLRLSIRMTTEEPVRRFQAVVNCGTVYGPYQNGPGRKPVWMWVGVGEDALDVADLLRPWLSAPRRAQLVRVFRADV